MPLNAPTNSCQQGRHHQCNHRRGAAYEGGVLLKITKPSFLWRCGRLCHVHPERIGLLFYPATRPHGPVRTHHRHHHPLPTCSCSQPDRRGPAAVNPHPGPAPGGGGHLRPHPYSLRSPRAANPGRPRPRALRG